METGKARLIQQSAVLPWRRHAGGIEILLITTADRDKWVIPKGHLEPFLTAWQSAAKEAWEEGGVEGNTLPTPLGLFSYRKRGIRHEVEVYPMEVLREAENWPERAHRVRRWFHLVRASERVHHRALGLLIIGLPEWIESLGEPTP